MQGIAYLSFKESLEEIKTELNDFFNVKAIGSVLKNASINFNKDDMLLVFRPKDHPAVILVRECFENALRTCDTSTQAIKNFTKHFNENITDKIKDTFGSDYDEHIEKIKGFTLKDNETDFLLDMVKLGRIGFKENERLKYEETYAYWKKVSAFKENDREDSESKLKLQPIENLINDYFSQHDKDNHLDKILFVLADFGKGKSVFLRHYAAKLAKDYLKTQNGLFPVYFNLRDFKLSVVDINQAPIPLAYQIINADCVLYCADEYRLWQEILRIESRMELDFLKPVKYYPLERWN